MQWLIIFFLIGLVCLAIGLLKTVVNKPAGANHLCTGCGWTAERVQLCQVEKHGATIIAPLCFECAIKKEAMPVKALQLGLSYEA